jgi:hypothetical protein
MRVRGPARHLRAVAMAALPGLLLPGWAPAARAQAGWAARLDISPYPSPYLSDWESNPSIGTLTITNPTGADQAVLLTYRVTDQGGRLLASGRSDPQPIPPGPPTVIADFIDVSGASQHDQSLEDQMRRTGRLPEGENTACVAVTDAGGFVLAEDCQTFTIVYPDPPSLIGPLDGEALVSATPTFQWTPLQVPPAFQLTYDVRVSEVLEGQTPLQALVANIPVFETTTFGTNFEYPIGAPPLESGKLYAWRVQALDQNGYAASANDGRSDVWTFRYDSTGGGAAGSGAMVFSLYNAYDAETVEETAATDAAPTSAPSAETAYALNDICDHWTDPPPERIELGVNAPFGFMGLKSVDATLYRQVDSLHPTTPGNWWIFAQTASGRAVLMHGDCSSRFLGGFQWIASRKLGRDQSINDYLGTHLVGSLFESVEFGVWIVALHSGTVSAPDADLQASEFLGGRSLDVQRGLNGYIELNLQEHALWPLFQALGYDQDRIALQGFVGLDVSRAVGVGLGDSYEASVSQERSFLLLTASLPDRTPFGPLARIASSMHLSFQFEVKDSTGVNLTADSTGASSATKRSVEFVFRLMHTIDLRDDLFRTPDSSRALVGWIGADVAGEREQQTRDVAQRSLQKLNRAGQRLSRGHLPTGGAMSDFFGVTGVACAPKPDLNWKTDFVISYGLSGRVYLGSLFFEDPAVEIHIGPKAANGQRDLSFAFATHIGFQGYDQEGILGVSRVREYPDAAAPEDPACQRMRPRSTTVTGPTGATPAPAETGQTPAENGPAGPLSSPWHWEWKVAWDVIPAGALAKAVSGALGGAFFLLGLGGT